MGCGARKFVQGLNDFYTWNLLIDLKMALFTRFRLLFILFRVCTRAGIRRERAQSSRALNHSRSRVRVSVILLLHERAHVTDNMRAHARICAKLIYDSRNAVGEVNERCVFHFGRN